MPGISLVADQALRVTIDATPTTTAPSFCSTSNMVQDGTQLLAQRASLNGGFSSTTPVAVVAAYAGGTQDVQCVMIVNRDTVAHTFTLDKFTATSPDVVLAAYSLDPGYTLTITSDGVVHVANTYGIVPSPLEVPLTTTVSFQLTSYNPSGTTQTVDWSLGNHQYLDLTGISGSVTLSATVPTKSFVGTLLLKKATSAYDIAFWSSPTIVWDTVQPTWTGTANYRMRLGVEYLPDVDSGIMILTPGLKMAY